jgi:hypothetical protein
VTRKKSAEVIEHRIIESMKLDKLVKISIKTLKKNTEECVHRKRMLSLPAKVKRGITPERKKW